MKRGIETVDQAEHMRFWRLRLLCRTVLGSLVVAQHQVLQVVQQCRLER